MWPKPVDWGARPGSSPLHVRGCRSQSLSNGQGQAREYQWSGIQIQKHRSFYPSFKVPCSPRCTCKTIERMPIDCNGAIARCVCSVVIRAPTKAVMALKKHPIFIDLEVLLPLAKRMGNVAPSMSRNHRPWKEQQDYFRSAFQNRYFRTACTSTGIEP